MHVYHMPVQTSVSIPIYSRVRVSVSVYNLEFGIGGMVVTIYIEIN